MGSQIHDSNSFYEHRIPPGFSDSTVKDENLTRAIILVTDNIRVIPSRLLVIAGILLCAYVSVLAQVGDYEGRPVAAVEVTFEGSPHDPTAQAEFKSVLKIVAGGEYSAVKAHQSLQDLFASGRVASGRVEITEAGTGGNAPVRVRFVVQRQIVIAGVTLRLAPTLGTPI